MAGGVVVGILLLLVQAEHECSWATAAQSSQNADQHVGFQQRDGRLRNLGGPPQKQLRRAVFAPRSAWRSSFSPQTTGDGGSGPNVEAGSQAKPRQSSLLSELNQQSEGHTWTLKEKFGSSAADPREDAVTQNQQNWKDGAGTGLFKNSLYMGKVSPGSPKFGPGSSGKSPSFSEPSGSAQPEPSSSFRGQASASLFSPVGPAPPGRRVWMQTYARAPARKRTLQHGAKAARRSTETENPRSRPGSETRPEAAGSYKPRILTVERPAPGLAPAKVYDIPPSFGGWAIRRLGHSDQNHVEVQNPQLKPTFLQQKEVLKAKVPGLHPESRWSRVRLRPKL
ncbi:uncharacterized protein LOC112136255 [Oryzias melastigma]|uniref:uncharacterized protein LOC112136255 n=1 Tax=Oryzias melastigma TaxID=30732 RepID=UPI000CF7F897|nr:uncharacterized protein LOC112136255 [Oryzias melastigma]XP_024113618.1 uncharacterized protein LOC112136255 [Oryzias melastigma]